MITLAAFLGSLEYVLEEGAGNDWFNDQTIVRFAIVAVGLGRRLLLARAHRRGADRRHPRLRRPQLLDRLAVLLRPRRRALRPGLPAPIFLARVRGYDALEIGDTVFVTGAFMMLAAPIAGTLAPKVDPRAA